MILKPNFILLIFFVVSVRTFGLNNYNDYESTNCHEVLIRKSTDQMNYLVGHISTIKSCSKDYIANSTVRKKCEITTLPKTAILEDIFLFTLASSRANRSKLYFNVYCAICNGEKEFYQFPPYFHYQLYNERNFNISDSINLEDRKYYPVSEHSFLLGNLKMDEQNKELISFNRIGIKYKFNPYRALVFPKKSKIDYIEPMLSYYPFHIPLCSDSSYYNFECEKNFTEIDNCYYDDGMYSNVFNSQKAILDLNTNRNRSTNATFCTEKHIDAGSESSQCEYEDENGYYCWWNSFLKKGVHYVEGENGEIFFADNYTMMNMTRDEYTVETGLKNVIYLCGLDDLKDYKNKYCIEVVHSIQCLLRRFSLFCVIVYLLINGRCERLSNLADKISYSYYVTLLMMYCREEVLEALDKISCFLEYTAYRYVLLSYVFWVVIGTWYLWIIIRSPGAEHAYNENVVKSRLIYLSMCLIGWVLPAVIGLLFYTLEPSPPCPIMRGYNNLKRKTCKLSDEPDAYYWFIFVTICIIAVIVSAQLTTACYHYHYYSKKKQDEVNMENTDWTTRIVFVFKIVYSINLYLMLLVTSMINREGAVYSVLLHLWSFHGTLIFFLYSFKMTVMKLMISKRGLSESAATADRSVNGRRCQSKENVSVN